ncbi:MAG: GIY-YIG nuclease family protein [Rickettsiales bacterium]
MSLGRSIRLFLVDGSPKGIINAEVVNWTGRISLVPRLKLPEFIQREEEGKAGVYVLAGPSIDEFGESVAYIGETDDIVARLKNHNNASTGKDFWDSACVITSKDANLTKAHVKYIESKLLALATEYRRATLENNAQPIYLALPESDQADMQYFIQQIQLVLPVLGINIFQEQAAKNITKKPEEIIKSTSKNMAYIATDNGAAVFELTQVAAKAQIIDGEFVLLRGSQIKKTRQPSDNSFHLLQRYLRESRITELDENSDLYKTSENIAFRSPSGACCLILGRASNGRTEWKHVHTGMTFAQWEEEQTASAMPHAVEA